MKQPVNCSYCGVPLVRHISKSGDYFCSTAHKAAWQVAQREALGFDREWLVREYIEKRRSTYDIAHEVGRDAKRVWEWLLHYGIPIRPRGTDYGQSFKKGQTSAFRGLRHTDANRAVLRAIRIADGHVPYLKNGKHWLHHEGAVSPAWKGGITPDRQVFYESDEWHEAVKKVWGRDGAQCCRCGKRHNEALRRGTFHIHHVVSFMEKSLRASVDNLVLLCRDCHFFVHSKKNTGSEFLRSAA